MLFILGNPYYTHSQYGKVDLTKVKEDYPLLKEGKLLYATYERKARTLHEFDPDGNPYFIGKEKLRYLQSNAITKRDNFCLFIVIYNN